MEQNSQRNLSAFKQRRRVKTCNNMASKIKSYDVFGAELNLKVGEDEKVKSVYGAICTGLMMALMIAYFGVQCQVMIQRLNPQIT